MKLVHLRGQPVVVLGLPRGGVPVAFEVAQALDAPLDVILVRKLGLPRQPELAMGAVGEDGIRVLDLDLARRAGLSDLDIATVEARERVELERRARRFRGERSRLDLTGRTAIIVDDGIATGSTARVACHVARAHGAARVVLAVPVAPPDWKQRMGTVADELIALTTPKPFWAVGQFYDQFSQTTDDEVMSYLERAARRTASRTGAVEIAIDGVRLAGDLTIPERAGGIVVFAHGSDSSRHSPRNRYVAAMLHEARLGTLLFDLLTVAEADDRGNVFDIELLAHRLGAGTRWLRSTSNAGRLPVGYFGASTGSAAALWAAAEPGADIAAIVSRGGRPDLVGTRLAGVTAPTLLIVGGEDHLVLRLNREAQAKLRCEHHLAVVPGATHLFEEPGTLQVAAALARKWFVHHFATREHAAAS